MNQLFGNPLGGASPLAQMGLGNNMGGTGIANLLAGGLKCSQNEQRLMAEKSQRNILRKYLTQATGDPIQSALISSTIPGKGFGDTLDVGLGTRSSIMQSLGLAPQTQSPGLLGTLGGLGATQSPGLLGSLGGLGATQSPSLLGSLGGLGATQSPGLLGSLGGTTNTLGTLGTLGSLANLGKSQSANTGLLSSLVNLASTPNNNGNILNSLGGLGSGLGGNSSGGLLGNIQSGINTLNTINKVNNAVSGVKGLFA
jgi:hypothetical protein